MTFRWYGREGFDVAVWIRGRCYHLHVGDEGTLLYLHVGRSPRRAKQALS